MSTLFTFLIFLARFISHASASHPYELQGTSWPGPGSPLHDQDVKEVQGTITAIDANGFWITGDSDGKDETSDSIYVVLPQKTSGSGKGHLAPGAAVKVDGYVDKVYSYVPRTLLQSTS